VKAPLVLHRTAARTMQSRPWERPAAAARGGATERVSVSTLSILASAKPLQTTLFYKLGGAGGRAAQRFRFHISYFDIELS
jgi:hypothetical protein